MSLAVGECEDMTDGRLDFRTIRGLEDVWRSVTGGAARDAARPVPWRALLDTLGLGLEQTISYLGRERPAWDAFVAWTEATAGGASDGARGAAIARYHAWYDGAPIPDAELRRQAAIMAAEPVFSEIEMAAWARDGVVVLHQAITRDEAAAIAAHLWRLKAATPTDPASWYGRGENGIMVQAFQHPTMEVPRRSARVHRGFAQLYGHADLLVSTDRLSFNPPVTDRYAFPGPNLHWDTSLAGEIPFETQAILYLTDTEATQGALRVVPGFHHRLAQGWLETLGTRDPRTIDLTREAVPIAAAPGDLVIWRQDLPHGASANTADRPRMAQYVTMSPMRWPDMRRWL
ncbi:phytanoyl-CoA dioxygenase family protein [Sphingomonas sp. Leaf242]|uniref:phytanoyl-CoA dioxygenase family protein n=1 Tax=Sphingomonas sp. Leaf242 TaxID=1736304 RepID=UPI0012E19AFD|nr:phytanoyl-CoA dioxygenase family protein [Sphingomonas sp. Leaf242]